MPGKQVKIQQSNIVNKKKIGVGLGWMNKKFSNLKTLTKIEFIQGVEREGCKVNLTILTKSCGGEGATKT